MWKMKRGEYRRSDIFRHECNGPINDFYRLYKYDSWKGIVKYKYSPVKNGVVKNTEANKYINRELEQGYKKSSKMV